MAKAMYSMKAGSVCADPGCKAEIKIGDPIVYFRPGVVYGLSCHLSERQEKWRRQLPPRTQEERAEARVSIDLKRDEQREKDELDQASALWR